MGQFGTNYPFSRITWGGTSLSLCTLGLQGKENKYSEYARHHQCTVATNYRPPDPYARVNAVAALCFGKGAFAPPPPPLLNIVSSGLQPVHIVHHLCTMSTGHTRVTMYVHSVYELCTVPTCMHSAYMYAQRLHVCTVPTCMHSVYGLYSGNIRVRSVYELEHSVYMYACIHVNIYACV